MDNTHKLMRFGLTHQEARLYELLCAVGLSTGYELAKAGGISRSNTYAALASLAEKGAAYTVDGKPVRYQAIPAGEFCRNVTRSLTALTGELEAALAAPEQGENAYYTIRGSDNIHDKIVTLLENTVHRVYLSMTAALLERFLPGLRALAARGCKVVVITDRPCALEGATVHLAPQPVQHLRLICDTRLALTGDWDGSPGCSCLFSGKKNLVDLLRDSMKNEILLTQLPEGAPK